MIRHYTGSKKLFNTNESVLNNVFEATVTESGNGAFDLELTCSIEYADRIKKQDIITASTPRGDQPFRVYQIEKNLNELHVRARHIFYDLASNYIEDGRPTDTTAAGAFTHLKEKCSPSCDFEFIATQDKINTAYYIRKTMLEALMGADNSILARWGGYLVRDGYRIELLKEPRKRGKRLEIGRDILGVTALEDTSEVVTIVQPTWVREGEVVETLPEKFIFSPNIHKYAVTRTAELRIELSDEEKLWPVEDLQKKARAEAQAFLEKADKPLVNYEIDIVDISKTEQYKDFKVLHELDIWDEVLVRVGDLGLDLTAAVIAYEWDALLDVMKKVEVGNARPTTGQGITQSQQKLERKIEDTHASIISEVTQMQEEQADLLTGAKGGSIVFVHDADGFPIEMLTLDTKSIGTAKYVIRLNSEGLGFSKNGVNGPFDIAMTAEKGLFAKFIYGLKVTAAMIEAGAITTEKLATGAVTARKIQSGTITAAEIASDAIKARHISAGAVTADVITTGKLQGKGSSYFDLDRGVINAIDGHFSGNVTSSTITESSMSAGGWGSSSSYSFSGDGTSSTKKQTAQSFEYQSGHINNGVTIGRDLTVSSSGVRLNVGGKTAVFENTGSAWLGIWSGNPDIASNAIWAVRQDGQVVTGSDRRLKENIRRLDPQEAVDFMRSFNFYDFNLRATGDHRVGVIANFFKYNDHRLAPLIISRIQDDILGVNYEQLSIIAAAAFKAVDERLQDLEAKVANLIERLEPSEGKSEDKNENSKL